MVRRRIANALEPGAIVIIFAIGTLVNRRKRCRLPAPPLREDSPADSQKYIGDDSEDALSLEENRTSRRKSVQSRALAQFPFLLELGYWTLIYWIYQGLRAASAKAIRGKKPIFDNAERHGLQILALEHIIQLDVELGVQRFVLGRVPWLMRILARVYYSHIVLGVAFYVYCYTFFSRAQYRRIRRTMALENIITFTIISLWRCMPPRLLPEEYGFVDVLHSNKGGSAWTQNKFQLTIAAMPSLHFGNSAFIAFCLVNFSPHRLLRTIAPLWPVMMGLTIIATANHYVLDAAVGTCVITAAYQFNHVMLLLLPVERVLLRLLRLEKPNDGWQG